MYSMDPKHLTPADIKAIETGMNAEDLEFMVATVDRLIELKLKAAKAVKTIPRRRS
jgi:hypothetical protein